MKVQMFQSFYPNELVIAVNKFCAGKNVVSIMTNVLAQDMVVTVVFKE